MPKQRSVERQQKSASSSLLQLTISSIRLYSIYTITFSVRVCVHDKSAGMILDRSGMVAEWDEGFEWNQSPWSMREPLLMVRRSLGLRWSQRSRRLLGHSKRDIVAERIPPLRYGETPERCGTLHDNLDHGGHGTRCTLLILRHPARAAMDG